MALELAQASPWGAVASAVGQAISAPPAGPSNAESSGSVGGASLDNSGWNVTFGNNAGIRSDRDQTQPGTIGQGVAGLLGNPMMLVVAAVVGVLVLKKLRR